jgi:transposase
MAHPIVAAWGRVRTSGDVEHDWIRQTRVRSYSRVMRSRKPAVRPRHVRHWRTRAAAYAGMKAKIVDRTTGEVTEVELFVAVLGASNYTFAEATRTQQVPDFAGSIARALTFIGGVPNAIVPDQLKSAVTGACRYEPAIQRTTAELGRHYGTTILPARPKSPRDKRRWKPACWSPNDGCSRASATRRSRVWVRSTLA